MPFLRALVVFLGTVSNCNTNSLFTINSQAFVPDPPTPGQDATLWVDYTVPSTTNVTGGTAVYTFTFNGIPFSPTVDDLCTQDGLVCPILGGTYNLSSTNTFPTGLSGKITSKMEWFDDSGNSLLCSLTTVKV